MDYNGKIKDAENVNGLLENSENIKRAIEIFMNSTEIFDMVLEKVGEYADSENEKYMFYYSIVRMIENEIMRKENGE